MLCREKATLLETYVFTARKFADAVSRVSEDGEALSHEDFEIVYRRAEDILQDLAAAKMKFEAHLKVHSC